MASPHILYSCLSLSLGLAATLAEADNLQPWSASEMKIILSLSPERLPDPPSNPSNRFADREDAAQFGQKIFFDPRFSGRLNDGDNDGSEKALGRKGETGKVACAGCHQSENHFQDFRSVGRQISLAAGWGTRRTPMLLDVAQAPLWMWDGRHDTLFGQIFDVIESPVEFNSARLFVAHQIFEFHKPEYEAIFGPLPNLQDTKRFPKLGANEIGCRFTQGKTYLPCIGPQRGGPGDKAEFDKMTKADQHAITGVVANMGKAIEAYLRKLKCGPGRFDKWVRGDKSAMNSSEQNGLRLFIGKARCITCHSGPFLTDFQFHNIGLRPAGVGPSRLFIDKDDQGAYLGFRQGIATPLSSHGPFSDGKRKVYPRKVDKALKGAFRTPTLRCVRLRPSFFHTGQMTKLEDVMIFFSRGGDQHGYPGRSEIKPLELTESEQADLVHFLETLTGPGPTLDLLKPPES
ncbi:MAG: cytochrome-c peroxidase [Bdellovibrionales bacterium]